MSKLENIALTKLYYSIGEVAAIFDVNTSLIRFWEKEFTVIQPKKNKKGNRLFTVKDIEHFNKIYQLVKEQGYTLDGAKKALKSVDKATSEANHSNQNEVLIDKLEKIKSKLLELKK
ncbi:MerR family transcriptional regulator [Fluviicola sp.]|uniref:MerR family transcriptional regulator n=1 Tax=Fluviicola sp. TaxID=1917219 RepID=UPI0031E04A3B